MNTQTQAAVVEASALPTIALTAFTTGEGAKAAIVADLTALASAMTRVDDVAKAAKADTTVISAARATYSALLATTALKAVLAKVEDDVKETYKGTETWKRVKGAWSTGSAFAREMLAGNGFVVPAEKTFVIAGETYEAGSHVGDEVLAALAARNETPEGETSILVLGKARSAHKSRQRAAREASGTMAEAALAAFLRSPEGEHYKAEGEDAETVALRLHEAGGDAYAEALKTGNRIMQEEAAQASALEVEKQRHADLEAALGVIERNMSEPVAARLDGLVAAFRDKVKTINPHATKAA